MSMTSELVKELRDLQDNPEIDCYGIRELNEVCKKAADTIEELSAHTNGWISVDNMLPTDGFKVLVWYEYFRYGDYNRMVKDYGIGWQYNGMWSGDVQGTNARCIAWQPLPPVYKKAGD